MKTCSKCKITKTLEEFYRKGENDRTSRCKACGIAESLERTRRKRRRLAAIIYSATTVVQRWEKGDLAAAVRELEFNLREFGVRT